MLRVADSNMTGFAGNAERKYASAKLIFTTCMVMFEGLAPQWELVEGSDLLDFLNEHGGRLSETVSAHIFQQLITAVGPVRVETN